MFMKNDNVIELETKYYKLEKLVKWEHVKEVNSMLLSNISPNKVSEWCKAHGFDISRPKLYEYKFLLQEAIAKRVTVERLLGIGAPKRTPIILQALGVSENKEQVKSELEVLDAIIQRGFDALATNPTVRIQDAMKAIEMKNKLTGGAHGGFTNYGLDHIRKLEEAKFNAVVEVVKKYIDPSHLQELEEAIMIAERDFYKNEAPELLEQYEESLKEEETNPDIGGVSNE